MTILRTALTEFGMLAAQGGLILGIRMADNRTAYMRRPLDLGRHAKIGHNKPPIENWFVEHYNKFVSSTFDYLNGLSSPRRRLLLKAINDRLDFIERADCPGTEFERLVHDLQRRPPTMLPKVAPALYIPKSGIKPSAFLKLHYGDLLDAGVLCQHHVRRLDAKLVLALNDEFRGKRDELRALLPPKSAETERLLAQEPFLPESKSAQYGLVAALRPN